MTRESTLVQTTLLDGGVACLTLNDPDRLNALTVPMGEAFQHAVRELGRRADVRAVVLTGAGRAFSAGGDLAFLEARAGDTAAHNVAEMRAFYARFLSVRDLAVPVIAAVNGHAVGAGASLATACDLRVVSETARIGFTFVRLGLHPGMGATHFLPRRVGWSQATRLLTTGERIDGHSAFKIRWADELTSPEATFDEAVALARAIAEAGPEAVRSTVATMRAQDTEGLDRALMREADAQAASYASAHLREGIAAIRDKRVPRFG